MHQTSQKRPRIFAITNQKGGVGKTTTSINLATAFSALGHKVLLIDMDPQGNAGTGLGVRRSMVKSSVYDVLFGRATVAEATIKTKVPRLHVLPSSVHLSGADVELSNAQSRESRLKKALSGLDEYEYIFIDCPPSLNFLTLNALTAAQSIIVPLQCEFYALEGLSQLTKTVKLVQKHYNAALDIHGIVLTMYDKRNRISKLVADDVRGYFEDKVYNTTIPRNVRLSEAPSYGLPALVYDMRCAGAQAYIKLAREILSKEKQNNNQTKVAQTMIEDLDITLDDIEDEDESSDGLQGLGRGLNALFDDEEASAVIEEIEQRIQSEPEEARPRHTIGVEQLYPSPFQPRRIFSDESIAELASSIAQYGVLQPLLVREDPANAGNYEIIAGERRWRAAQKAQLHEVPVIMLDISELDAFKIALIENLQREDLDPIDEAMGYQKLLEEYGQTQEDLAKAVGKSRPHITNMVRLLNLPSEVQAHLSAGDLTMGHARALITSDDPSTLAKQVISKGLSVRQTEKLAADKKGVEQKTRARAAASPKAAAKDADTIALENDISNALGMQVGIDSTDGKSGKITIEFKSLDQLDEVLHRLAHFPGSRLTG